MGRAAETRETREDRGATGRGGVAVARRRPAGLVLGVTLGTRGSSGLCQSDRSGKHGHGGVGVQEGWHWVPREESVGCPFVAAVAGQGGAFALEG